jgi:hypothetical protein
MAVGKFRSNGRSVPTSNDVLDRIMLVFSSSISRHVVGFLVNRIVTSAVSFSNVGVQVPFD